LAAEALKQRDMVLPRFLQQSKIGQLHMNKFALIHFSAGLLGALVCFIIIWYFLSNSDMTTGELISTALSTMDTFNKITVVTAIVIGIVLALQNYKDSVVGSKWEKDLSDKEIFLLEKFRRADPKIQAAIINILKEPFFTSTSKLPVSAKTAASSKHLP
jgi:hypothetical protein